MNDLNPAIDGCDCPCHKEPGTIHLNFIPCCGIGSFQSSILSQLEESETAGIEVYADILKSPINKIIIENNADAAESSVLYKNLLNGSFPRNSLKELEVRTDRILIELDEAQAWTANHEDGGDDPLYQFQKTLLEAAEVIRAYKTYIGNKE